MLAHILGTEGWKTYNREVLGDQQLEDVGISLLFLQLELKEAEGAAEAGDGCLFRVGNKHEVLQEAKVAAIGSQGASENPSGRAHSVRDG